jgi:adenylylsulfate kinase-like enzyme
MEREVRWATTDDTQDFGRRLGSLLRGGDVLVLTGDLGAGKTTLTQGLAEQLSESRLELNLTGDDVRTAHLVGVGDRWDDVLDALAPDC